MGGHEKCVITRPDPYFFHLAWNHKASLEEKGTVMLRQLFRLNWAIGAVLLTACVSLPVVTSSPIPDGDKITAPYNAVICVLVPPDAVFEGQQYAGSGDEIADHIKNELEKDERNARLVKAPYSNADAQCKENGAQLALETRILHYEDRWAGSPDRIELKLILFELEHPDRKRSIYYKAKSNVLFSAFFEWGDAKPYALLGNEFRQALRNLTRDGSG